MVFDMVFETPFMNFDMVSKIQENWQKHCNWMKAFQSIKINVKLDDLGYGF